MAAFPGSPVINVRLTPFQLEITLPFTRILPAIDVAMVLTFAVPEIVTTDPFALRCWVYLDTLRILPTPTCSRLIVAYSLLSNDTLNRPFNDSLPLFCEDVLITISLFPDPDVSPLLI